MLHEEAFSALLEMLPHHLTDFLWLLLQCTLKGHAACASDSMQASCLMLFVLWRGRAAQGMRCSAGLPDSPGWLLHCSAPYPVSRPNARNKPEPH